MAETAEGGMAETEIASEAEHAPPALPWGRLFVYALPAVGVGFMLSLVSMGFLYFSTEVLLLAPASIATLFGVARLWDGITDPVAGGLSDRTHTRWGRRRPFMFVAACLLPFLFVALFNPPMALGDGRLLAWCAVALLAFYTATTVFLVPHQALGAELSDDPKERTWIFGGQFVAWNLGMVAAVGVVILIQAADEPRSAVGAVTVPLAFGTAALMVLASVVLRERPEFQGRGSPSLVSAFSDVFRNPHARPLMVAYFIDSVGMATVIVLVPYVSEYLLGGAERLGFFFGFYFVPAIVLAPLWPGLAARVGKKRLWVVALVLGGATFGSFFFLDASQLPLLCLFAGFLGVSTSAVNVVLPSLQADVIDWDEWKTGQRKEGAYYATRTFLMKCAYTVMVMSTGYTLQAVGHAPAATEQSETTQLALRVLFSLVPATCYAVTAAYVIPSFHYDADEHARIRRELDERKAAPPA